ncbi:MAG TPA: DUF1761 domain-containing protein [Rhodospirillaceae bacterium]|nr:DUF1761 domain-containing protein [Rhodospirillaceae bacterium]
MPDYKKIIFATLSYIILTMAIAYPWHMIWFHSLYETMGAVTRPEPIIPLGMLSMLIQGIVIAYLYPFWYKGGNPAVQGVKFMLIVGLLIYSVMGFATVAKMNITPISTFLMYHTAFQLIQFVVTGAALGLIFGKKV